APAEGAPPTPDDIAAAAVFPKPPAITMPPAAPPINPPNAAAAMFIILVQSPFNFWLIYSAVPPTAAPPTMLSMPAPITDHEPAVNEPNAPTGNNAVAAPA